jgi:iron complex outermembrane receptor protein
MFHFKKTIIATSIAALCCFSAQAEEEASGEEIEQIMVTAQKRSQRIIDVPVSIAAISGEEMETAGIQQLSELSDYIPNLNIQSSESLSSAVYIRGVGADSRNIGFDTRVGVYIDGVYMGQSPAINQDLVELERVEVLRGPQGALFGKNTVAGAVNLISKKPSDELEAEVKVRLGNYDAVQFLGKVNVPLSDNVFLNLSASTIERDGYVDNLLTNDELDNRNSDAYRAQLRIDATESLEILATFDSQKVKQMPSMGEALTDPFGVFVVKPEANYQTNTNFPAHDDRELWGAALNVTYVLDNDLTIRSISSYRDTQSDITFDIDYNPHDIAILDYADSYKQTTQEFQLISPDDGEFSYLLGLYYYNQEGTTQRDAIFGGDVEPILVALNGPLPPSFIPSGKTTNQGTLDTKSFAVFGNFNYDLNERLHLGVGLRYTEETKDVDWSLDGSTSGLFGIGTGQIVDSRTDYDFSPSVSLNYDITGNIVAYARYAEGFKSGGYNLDYVSQDDLDSGVEFGKETAESYEMGLKGIVPNTDISFAFAVFNTTYNDYQVNQFLELEGGATSLTIRNAAKVTTKGYELEVGTQLTDNLALSASVGGVDATFDNFEGGLVGGGDAAGKKVPLAADFQGALALDYYNTLSENLEYTFHVGYTYTGSSYTTVDNVKEAITLAGETLDWGYIPAYDLVDARLSIGDTDDVWLLSLWARNAFDNNYNSGSTREFLGTLVGYLGEPRMFGIEAKYSF